jgi:cytochrome c biogenesis protein
MVRRRRVFVRARPGAHGTSVQAGGLARTDASGSFEDEFASLAAELRSAHEQAAASAPAATGSPVPPAAAADRQHEEE